MFRQNQKFQRIAMLAALLWASLPPVGFADDAWLIADPPAVQVAESVWIGFVGGQVFPLSDTLVAPEDLDLLVDLNGGEARVLAETGSNREATGRREQLDGRGVHVLAGQTLPLVISMSGTQFDDYLHEERAAGAILERLSDDPETEVVEEYTRFAKTLVQVGTDVEDDTGYAAVVGHRLEIVPLSNPMRAEIGDTLTFEVLLDGYPWPDVSISACREGFEARNFVEETLSDEHGRADIRLDSDGLWLVRAHFIRRTDGLRRAEWESFWATLAFHVGGEVPERHDDEIEAAEETESATAAEIGPFESVPLPPNPPLTFPLDELYGFFSPNLRMNSDSAA